MNTEEKPIVFRSQLAPGVLHPNGHNVGHFYGCYFPNTDLAVSDMGVRGTGKPSGVEWLEEGRPPHEGVELPCPYCGENDFDLIGLKGHFLHGDCDVFNSTTLLKRHF